VAVVVAVNPWLLSQRYFPARYPGRHREATRHQFRPLCSAYVCLSQPPYHRFTMSRLLGGRQGGGQWNGGWWKVFALFVTMSFLSSRPEQHMRGDRAEGQATGMTWSVAQTHGHSAARCPFCSPTLPRPSSLFGARCCGGGQTPVPASAQRSARGANAREFGAAYAGGV